MKKKIKLEVYEVEEDNIKISYEDKDFYKNYYPNVTPEEEKRSSMSKLNKLTFTCLTILCILLGIGIIVHESKFNPETDVCTYGRYCEEGYSIVGHCTYWFDEAELKDWEMNELKYYKNDVLECKEHRHKNFCEKCLDDWGYKEKDKCADPIGLFSMTCHTWEYKTCESECVCEEYEKIIVQKTNITLESKCCSQDKLIIDDDITFTQNWCLVEGECLNVIYEELSNGNCISAREKPKPIKIDLEEEKCVEHINETVETEEGTWFTDDCSYWIDKCISFNWSRGCVLYDQYCCVKKEKKNECDKGNPDYFQEDKNKFPNTATCRMKTLLDFECSELKKQLLIENYCIPKNKVWCYADEEVHDAMVDKGCQI